MPQLYTCHKRTEAGNAVALTLLGLAVAILAGVVVLVFVGQKRSQYIPAQIQIEATSTDSTVAEKDPYEGWETLLNEQYQFEIRYPSGWIVEQSTASDTPVFTVYDPRQTAVVASGSASTLPPHGHSNAVSIYPQGSDILTTSEKVTASKVILSSGRASAKDLLLEGANQPWATIVHFEDVPLSWASNGGLYAQVEVSEEEIEYQRGAQVISQEDYDPGAGDVIKRYGFVDSQTRSLEEQILLSFHFLDATGVEGQGTTTEDVQVQSVREDITVTEPLTNAQVTSPLVVRGIAQDIWFSEESLFSVVLEDVEGNTITIGDVRSDTLLESDGQEDIPFIVTLSFDPGTATSGVLIFSPAEKAEQQPAQGILNYTLPVQFTK
ncbi:MAG: hypothetical protein KBD21_01335 [Candidatus Pacebacteria bacterium]|nr:hypothetical protein [Candidatus Paceibacterota bacterium]